MLRIALISSLAVTLTAGLAATPALAVGDEEPLVAQSSQVARSDPRNPELAKRGSNQRLHTKRTGAGSVDGVSQLRRQAKQVNASRKLRVVTAYSSDGTVAGFEGVRTRLVTAGEVESAIDQAEANKEATAIQLDLPVRALGVAASSNPGGGVHAQWALAKLKANQVWEQSTGQGVKVAVLDTGVQADHPDLVGQVLPGKDFVDPQGDAATDPNGHGTHVSGIVAASMNSIGITGLAPDAKIIPIRVLDKRGGGYFSAVVNGIYEAANRGAEVINMSLGGEGSSDATLDAAVAYARLKGVAVVAASGNSGDSTQMIPASASGVISVGSSTSNDVTSEFSTFNNSVDLSAPGSAIISTISPAGYQLMNGTSMAAPYASATLAVALAAARSKNSAATGVGVEEPIFSSAVDLGARGRDNYYGHGRVDPLAAISRVISVRPTSLPAVKPKPAKASVKIKVRIRRANSKLRRVEVTSQTAAKVKIKLSKLIGKKWRSQRNLSLKKKSRVTLRLGAGRYKLTRSSSTYWRKLNLPFRVR